MNIAEKILAAHCGRKSVKPGEMIVADIDMVLGTDVTASLSIEVFRNMGATKVFDPDKIALVNDHFVPAKDVKAAELSKTMREFGREQGIENYFEVGRSGICHSILPDKGLVRPGDLIVGADSHTCTYGALGAFATGVGSTDMSCAWALGELWFRVPTSVKITIDGELPPFVGPKDIILHIIGKLGVDGARYEAIEFDGSTIRNMSIDGRITICNMAIEAGAKTGIIAPDDITAEFMRKFPDKEVVFYESDRDAEYSKTFRVDGSKLKPQVAAPYLPGNTKSANEFRNVKVDQVIIGSCTNGRLEDFIAAGKVLDTNPVHPDVRMIMVPATPDIAQGLIDLGLMKKFIAAGAVVSPSTCGACIGGHMGILADGEVGLFTTNRNFRGRNGHADSQVYLASPEVAAATALTGRITDPNNL